MLKKLRVKIGESILKRKLKLRKRDRRMYNFQTAQVIGVLFKTNNASEFHEVKNFLHYLRELNNKVIALCYIDSKKIPDYYLLVKGFNFFSKSSVNFFYIPKHQLVYDFIEHPMDILIDLNLDESFPIKYIGALANARFKIGPRQKTSEKYYDMMIDIEKNKSLTNLIENIKHYIPIFANTDSVLKS